MINHFVDIQYAEDSGENCDMNVKIEYNRWNEKLIKMIIIIARLTKVPANDYFFVPVVAISAIMKEMCKQLNLSNNHKTVFSELIKKILNFGNGFIAKLIKNDTDDFRKIYELLQNSENMYAPSCHDMIMQLIKK